MDINQFAVYQLKNIPENRQIRFRPYKTLQEKGIQVRHGNYEQAYLGRMQTGETPESIRQRFSRQLPRTFKGHFRQRQRCAGAESGGRCDFLLC